MADAAVARIKALIRAIRFTSAFCGANVFVPNYRVSFLTWFVGLTAIGALVFTGYTSISKYLEDGDWTIILKNLSTCGNAVQGCTKLLNAILKQNDMRILIVELEEIFEEYRYKRIEYQKDLIRSARHIYTMIKIFGSVNLFVMFGMPLTTLYFYLFRDMRLNLLHFTLPGLNTDTTSGYLILQCCHMFCILISCFGNGAADLALVTPITCCALFKDIFKSKLGELSTQLEQDVPDRRECNKLLRDAISWHQRYLCFLGNIESTYYWVLFVQISTGIFGVGATVFCLMLNKWPGGELFLIYSLVTLYVYCGLGTVVEVTNDSFIESCYNRTPWYKLPKEDIKMLKLNLFMCQQTQGLMVAGIAPLNMNLAVQISKTIYSFTMCLVSFL